MNMIAPIAKTMINGRWKIFLAANVTEPPGPIFPKSSPLGAEMLRLLLRRFASQTRRTESPSPTIGHGSAPDTAQPSDYQNVGGAVSFGQKMQLHVRGTLAGSPRIHRPTKQSARLPCPSAGSRSRAGRRASACPSPICSFCSPVLAGERIP